MTRRNLELVEPLRAGARGCTLLETIDAHGDADGRPAAAPVAALAAPRAGGDRRPARRGGGGGAGRPRAGPGCARRSTACATSSGWPAAPRPAARRRASWARCATRFSGFPTSPAPSASWPVALPDGGARRSGRRGRGARPAGRSRGRAGRARWRSGLPPSLADGGVIRPGYDAELDELRSLRDGGRQYIASLQQRERERTGIPSLKVGFNKVFGYYLEITHAHAGRGPGRLRAAADAGHRRALRHARAQGLRGPGARRRGADGQPARPSCSARSAPRWAAPSSGSSAPRGCWPGSTCGRAWPRGRSPERYVRPRVHAGFDLTLRESRHPVIERMMAARGLHPQRRAFHRGRAGGLLVTGPNMAGKSTILRQIGLCVVLAQMGAFVPAAEASVGVVDRLFTRVGASDNLARGQSTFMVEMSETSAILHNATARSLVLLDEIGRGTSTYDGVAIAWAVTEHLHDRVGCKTMFATHYHELMQLPERLQHARNYNVAVRETGDTSSSSTGWSRAAPTAPTASTWPSWPGSPAAWWRGRGRSLARSRASTGWCRARRRRWRGRPGSSRSSGRRRPTHDGRAQGARPRCADPAGGAQPSGRAPAPRARRRPASR